MGCGRYQRRRLSARESKRTAKQAAGTTEFASPFLDARASAIVAREVAPHPELIERTAMSSATLVLFLHIVAACIWIGGQVTVAVVLPALRGHPDLIRTIGRRFQVLAWSAYGVLIVTGAGNALLMGLGWGDLTGTTEGRLLLEKLGLVLLSGAAAAVHVFVQAPRSRARLSHRAFSAWSAVLGSVSLLAALGAALYGVVIARGG